jgi:hypothetical protein
MFYETSFSTDNKKFLKTSSFGSLSSSSILESTTQKFNFDDDDYYYDHQTTTDNSSMVLSNSYSESPPFQQYRNNFHDQSNNQLRQESYQLYPNDNQYYIGNWNNNCYQYQNQLYFDNDYQQKNEIQYQQVQNYHYENEFYDAQQYYDPVIGNEMEVVQNMKKQEKKQRVKIEELDVTSGYPLQDYYDSNDDQQLKRKRKRILNKIQREEATMREKRRMLKLNKAFEELRKALPLSEFSKNKLSRADTLKSAIEYIERMVEMLQDC